MKVRYLYYGLLLIALFNSGCQDWFDLRPQSETVQEEFWQDENDVKSVIGACYRQMNEPAVIERLIVWGEVRSDNVIKGMNPSTDLTYILNLALNASNSYTSWNDFYKIINYCNCVIQYAPDVRNYDPNFTEGQLRAYIAEAKGIRALCYFTLVRTFRNIPLVTTPTVGDGQSFNVAQSSPDDVINFLIDDLKGVENSAVTGYDNAKYDKGRITQKAIRSLIADMYLWENNYSECVTYCDKVLGDASIGLELETSSVYNNNIYIIGNSKESIFELQFDIQNINNYVIYEMYERTGTNVVSGGRAGYNTYQLSAYDFKNKTSLFGATDLRAKNAYYSNSNSAFFPIMKYISARTENANGTVTENDYKITVGSPNWIFYRLADICLMKAEALVELGGADNLEAAFNLVSKIYERANPDLGVGALAFANYNTQSLMRDLVFDERQREFIFEGKRYFDLIRRINRTGDPASVVNSYLLRKYSALDQATAQSRLNDINALYMPINATELKLNTALVQNPFYVVSSDSSKN